MIFDYNLQEQYTEQIQVDDIGNCALRCFTTLGEEFYVVTKTVMGKTAIVKFGPIISDSGILIEDFFLFFKKIDYKEAVIEKDIDKFINDRKRGIASIEELEPEDAINMIPSSTAYFETLM